MDISAFKNISSYGSSLVDFLNTGSKSTFFDGASQNLLAKVNSTLALAAEKTGSNVNVTLSEEAQKLLASSNSSADAKLTGVKKSAQDFMMGFFDQSGLDLSNLSAEALGLIDGLNGVIASSAGTQRDITTDIAENKYAKGSRESFTLTGNGTRLRIAIEYAEGKPTKLSVTDITNGVVETADFTFEARTSGKPVDIMTVERTQRAYANGHMVSLEPIDPLSVNLYEAQAAV